MRGRLRRSLLIVVAALVASLGLTAPGSPAGAVDPCASPANPVIAENCLPGTPQSTWDVSGAGDATIQGFATQMSVNTGETVHFKISTTAAAFHVDIYRIGWYQGDGARLVASIPSSATVASNQPACLTQPSSGLVDCGNWSESASWATSASTVSGVFIARLIRNDNGGASHIPFVVRDDTSHSDLLYETSDTTWQAYNQYGPNSPSLYTGSGPGINPSRAYKVSYNRPFVTRAATAEDSFFNAEYPMVRFLERNGYDLSYLSGSDTDRISPAQIEQHKVFLSVGHDEYWSGPQRAHVEAARDAGVNIAFFSGNQIFWKTRWENSIDGTNTARRTLVSYKETHANGVIDPADPPTWTGTWRDPRFSPPADGGRPENALAGTIFTVNDGTSAITVPASNGAFRIWRNTPVVALESGSATLGESTLGYEWNEDLDNGFRPAGQIDLSKTTLQVPQRLTDFGSTYAPGTATHSLTLHRAPSGALVFDAGTIQWSWGLDGTHDRGETTPDPAMQQATVNVLADLGAQPGTLMAGMVAATASTDTTGPTSAITSPNDGDSLPRRAVTVTGSASDTGGGTVAGVEVSTDNGTTWHPAQGTDNWTYTFTPATTGVFTLKARVTDDSANTGSVSAAVTINVTPQACPCSLWDPSATPALTNVNDNNAGQSIENGTRFRSEQAGEITALRFYKGSADTGTHIARLWTNTGTSLASKAFSNETGSGWQQVTLDAPVQIAANTTYVAAVFSSAGFYVADNDYFISPYDNTPLHGLQDGLDGANGIYHYGGDAFPTDSFRSSNYWIDVVLSTGPDMTPPIITSRAPAPGATNVSPTAPVVAHFSEALDPTTVNASTFTLQDPASNVVPATVTYDGNNEAATLTPTTGLNPSTTYTARVRGGASGVKDSAGNALAADVTWSFQTAPPPPDSGPGGPILVVASSTNPFGRYYAEILGAEGLNEYRVTDISHVTAQTLSSYAVVVLGQMSLTSAQASMFSAWVNGGGDLIAMRPDADLAGLLGLGSASGSTSDAYVKVDTSVPPGKGITNQTIQFHGTADRYNLNGAATVATLYSNATTATAFPAVTTRAVGSGTAAAFTYDLARSVVYTRQGNPAWSGQERDGIAPVRSDDLFFGNAVNDPQPDWVNLNKVQIPQADEQQRLLANMIVSGNRMLPLPHFWYLPRGVPAAVVMTGDDHANGGTAGRFDAEIADSPPSCVVADWQCVRSTSYVYTNAPLTNAQAASYVGQGFEVGLHVTTNSADWTPSTLADFYASQLADWRAKYMSIPSPVSSRTHCIPESDYATQPHVELANGIRFDTNYYYWPPSWIQDRPGMFTGSGFPMRFADPDGSSIDVYQAPTQMTDESGQSYPANIDALLNNATSSLGYYGVFTANMHTDNAQSDGSDAIIASAQAHNVPVVSSKQMLDWLDGRNNASFGAINYANHVLQFSTAADATKARGIQAMLPITASDGATLGAITRASANVPFSTRTVKGIAYAVFDASSGNYTATYSGGDNTPPTTSMLVPSNNASVRGTATLDAAASDNVGVIRVEFHATGPGLANDALIGTGSLSPYGWVGSWNTSGLNGTYSVSSIAFDAARNSTRSATINVKVDNTSPSTSMLVPANNASIRGTATLDAAASDNVGVTRVEFHATGPGLANDALIGTGTLSPYGWVGSWNTSGRNGSYTLSSIAFDAAGNSTRSATIAVKVDNTPPSTSMLVPANNASIHGTATLDAAASDNVGVTRVEFHATGPGLANDALIGTGTLSPYGWIGSWNTSGRNGSYTLSSIAFDAAGNSTRSATITVMVSN